MSKNDYRGPGLTRMQLEDRSIPRKDQPIVELRFVNPDGETEVWLIGKDALPWTDADFRDSARLAYLDRGVDTRLATQHRSIDRLLQHVKFHEAQIASDYDTPNKSWVCNFQEEHDGPTED